MADALAALVTVPLLTWLGYRFGQAAVRDVTYVGRILLGVVVAAAVAAIAVLLVRQRRARASASG